MLGKPFLWVAAGLVSALMTVLIVLAMGYGTALNQPMLAYLGPGADASDIYVADLARDIALNVTRSTVLESAPVWSPNGGLIAFATFGGGGVPDLFVMGPDGRNRRQITHRTGYASDLRWMPDGDAIAYLGHQAAARDVYVLAADGKTPPQNVTAGQGDSFAPAWSPDGAWIAYVARDGASNSEIYLVDAAAMTYTSPVSRNLTNHPAADWSPAWGPDSQHLAFISRRDGGASLYILDIRTGVVERLGDREDIYGLLNWSPDGRWFIFRIDGGARVLIDAHTGATVKAFTTREAGTMPVVWAPDGTSLAFADYGGIALLDVVQNRITRITASSMDHSPTWRPQ